MAESYPSPMLKSTKLKDMLGTISKLAQEGHHLTFMAIARSSFKPLWLLPLCILPLLFSPSSALYFYLDGTTPKCFYEELPKDTLVVGEIAIILHLQNKWDD